MLKLTLENASRFFGALVVGAVVVISITSSLSPLMERQFWGSSNEIPAPKLYTIYQVDPACYGNLCPPLQHHAVAENCTYWCLFLGRGSVENVEAINRTDVVLWDALHTSKMANQIGKMKHQRFIGFFWESPANWPNLFDNETLSIFDWEYSYRATAQIQGFGMIVDTAGNLEHVKTWDIQPFNVKKKNPMVATWISNCNAKNNRLEVLKELIEGGITVINYGGCHVHGSYKGSIYHDEAWEQQSPTFSKMKQGLLIAEGALHNATIEYEISVSLFHFAAENSNCEYYHTEKPWLGFNAGSIPIYIGYNETSRDYFPDHSVIFAYDFATVDALAKYLISVANNETAYMEYFEWRRKPLPERVASKIRRGLREKQPEYWCDFCEFIHKNYDNFETMGFKTPSESKCS